VATRSRPFYFRWPNWLRWLFLSPILYLALCVGGLVYLRFLDPVLTMVQLQRLIGAVFGPESIALERDQVELLDLSPNLQNAVVASEDARFWSHHGIDFVELREAVVDAAEDGALPRGGSTITQQLIKNLFFTTHRNPLRKLAEFVLAPAAELILPKERILELYLNNVEWAPGVYGAEAAAHHYYGHAARSMTRDQAQRLAAVLPAPLRWRPNRMAKRAASIEARMRQMGR
jgi:monofunctional glycosyltransferase